LTKQQKVIASVVLAVVLLSLGWTLLPFRFADAVDCGPPLLGAEPGPYDSGGQGFIKPERDCHNKAKSRLTVAAVAMFVANVVGIAAAATKPVSRECLAGNHDDCTEWWPAELGAAAEGYACQCECHY
jgi:hypothetical protein